MLKILHVTPVYEPAWQMGGVVRSTSLLCRALAGLSHDVTVFTTNSDGHGHLDVPVNTPVNVGGVKVYYFYTPTPSFLRYSRSLKNFCKETVKDFDIIHLASVWNYPGLPAAEEALKKGIPYLISTRGWGVPEAINSKMIKKWIYLKLFEERVFRNAAAFHFTSFLERMKMKDFKIKKDNFVIPNGIDINEFEHIPDRNTAKSSFGFKQEEIIITFIGRLGWIKALDILIRAFQRIHEEIPKAKIIIAGPDGGEKRKLMGLTKKLRLSDKIRFLGPVYNDNKLRLLAASDLFVLVSWSENFGNAALEAMAAGVPVLASRNVGISDIIKEDGAGVVVSTEEKAIAAAVIKLLSDTEKLENLRRIALESVRKRFGITPVAKLMATAYADIISGKRNEACLWEVC